MTRPPELLALPADGAMVRLAGEHQRDANVRLSLALEQMEATGEWPAGVQVDLCILSHIQEGAGFGEPPIPGERAFHLRTTIPDLGPVEFGFCVFRPCASEAEACAGALPTEDERNAEKLRKLIADTDTRGDYKDAAVCCFRATDEYTLVYAWRGASPKGVPAR